MIRLFFYCNEDTKKLLIIWTSMFWKHVIGLFVYLLVYWFIGLMKKFLSRKPQLYLLISTNIFLFQRILNQKMIQTTQSINEDV